MATVLTPAGGPNAGLTAVTVGGVGLETGPAGGGGGEAWGCSWYAPASQPFTPLNIVGRAEPRWSSVTWLSAASRHFPAVVLSTVGTAAELADAMAIVCVDPPFDARGRSSGSPVGRSPSVGEHEASMATLPPPLVTAVPPVHPRPGA